MGGIGMIIGAGLAGAGEGMMKAQIVKDQERRDSILAAYRRQEQKEGNDQLGQREEANDVRETKKGIAVEQVRGTNAANLAGIKVRADREDREDKQQADIVLETLKGKNSVNDIIAKARAEGNDIVNTEIDAETGLLVGITRQGVANYLKNSEGKYVRAKPAPKANRTADEPLTVSGSSPMAKPTNRPPLTSFQK